MQLFNLCNLRKIRIWSQDNILSIDWHKIWIVGRFFIFTAIGLYVFLIFYFGILQDRFIYFPERTLVLTPAEIGLQYETINFTTEDGIKLSGWFIPAKDPKGTLLFCHGNAGNISHRIDSINMFYQSGLSTFIFDYRGYGQSDGRPTEQGTYLDAEAALKYLIQERKFSADEIIYFGRSIGGSIAAWLAQYYTPKALVIESAFTSVKDIAKDLYPFLPVKLLVRFNYNTLDYLQKTNCPALIIHSRDDEIISYSHGQRLFEIANQPKEFLEISGSHNEGFILSVRLYKDTLDAFISKYD
jgi:pimeloyl-ACP methyl ester carboxylesterase